MAHGLQGYQSIREQINNDYQGAAKELQDAQGVIALLRDHVIDFSFLVEEVRKASSLAVEERIETPVSAPSHDNAFLPLRIPEDSTDEDVSSAIVSLLISAIHDERPEKTVSDVYHIIVNEGLTSHLDALNILPHLLSCNHPGAQDMVSLIGECGSAKEVVMTVQEAVERLAPSFDESDDAGTDREEPSARKVQLLVVLIDLYAAAIPRIKLRRKSASETVKPLFSELEAVLKLAGGESTRDEGCSLISGVSRLVQQVWRWKGEEQFDKVILKALLDRAAISFSQCIQSSIAQRTFAECFPRLAFRTKLDSDWEAGNAAIAELLDVYQTIGLDTITLSGSSSVSDLLLSAYRPLPNPDVSKLFTFLLPPLISSLESNAFLDESLAVLLRSLHTWTTASSLDRRHLPPEVTSPFTSSLPSVASAHPDPTTRHQAFRSLSMLLAASDPKLRFQTLVELARHSEFPQMRVAAVGLVKEGLLDALSQAEARAAKAEEGKLNVKELRDEIFLSPMFLRTFGPILFRPNPTDLFASDTLELKVFQETSEPTRLVECLSLYYVLLQRDRHNLTGIRDKDVLKTVENNLLTPLRRNLDRWLDDPAISESHPHDITPIVSLKISLERVDAAREALISQ
ncbi:hypothetical protein NLJ89_g11116 [Agrocybe chaxingu]|uniref:Uncharacterized protein n=1 Tax=Agrocybe chaxingu TaxID=84603 RepID=A0A9W8JPV8_9AGAR|nr:hypothetical protein NLJ89_g11116 [Agrocybe chaxingu]